MLTAAELKEVRQMVLAMIDRGCHEMQIEKAWRLALDQIGKLKAATAKPEKAAR